MSNWWADKLGAANRAPRANPNVQYKQTPISRLQAQAPAPPAPQPPPKVEDRCPGCNGTNYMAAPNSNYKRCYDCGYPLVQSGTGVGATHADAPTKSAVQVQTGGYNPSVIVGKVD